MRGHESANNQRVTPEEVLAGYVQGYFPMARGRYGEIDWFTSDPRTIVPLDDRFRVRRSLRRTMRKLDYVIGINTNFPSVIRACSRHDEVDNDEIWLSNEMIELYIELHRRGHAHSIEVYVDDNLVGGLYGIAIRSAFFGESMFSRVSSASQIALVELVERLRARGYLLLDAQMWTEHIGWFGAVDLPLEEYYNLLAEAMLKDCSFVDSAD